MKTKILFEDKDILVCHKPAGLAVETKQMTQIDMVSELKNYLRLKSSSKEVPYLAVIHRLDQPVEGVLVFGKNKKAAALLSEEIKQGKMKKIYLAAVAGDVTKETGELVDYLYKDGKTNCSRVVSKEFKDEAGEGGKRSRLSYQKLSTHVEDGYVYSVVRIELDTGRHHQIRVQFSNADMPLLGDLKYGNKKSIEETENLFIGNVQLCAYELSFLHPTTNEKVTFVLPKVPSIYHIKQ